MKKSTNTKSAWPAFLRAHAVLVAEIESRLKAKGLPALETYDVLWALEQAPGQKLRMHELSNAMVVTRSNLTRLVDRLEVQELVKRERDPNDRRGAFAVLTGSGRRLRREMWPSYEATIDELIDGKLSASEARLLREVFVRLVELVPR
jgi:DNA-binding MarR family transcriptional regulator